MSYTDNFILIKMKLIKASSYVPETEACLHFRSERIPSAEEFRKSRSHGQSQVHFLFHLLQTVLAASSERQDEMVV